MRAGKGLLTATAACLLTACSGFGEDPPVSEPLANVFLSGVASKGLVAGADVTVHPVKTDGSIDLSITLTTERVTTKADGTYALIFDAKPGQQYVVKITANSGTTHLDEVTKARATLPTGFSMRAMISPSKPGHVDSSASVTPFSEMAVAAAVAASGGITSENARQAASTLTQLLGFDPSSVAVRSTDDGSASVAEQKQAILLAAVSRLASSNAFGCSDDKVGDGKTTQCVVEKLASSIRVDKLMLEDGSGADISDALGTAVKSVLSDDKLRGKVNSTSLAGVADQLGCKTSCTAAAPVPAPDPSAGAPSISTTIQAAKNLLTQLKSDWISLFGKTSGGVSAVDVEASYVRQAMLGLRAPGDVLAKDMGALIIGVQLYRNPMRYRNSDGTFSVGRKVDLKVPRQFTFALPDGTTRTYIEPTYTQIVCELFSDAANSIAATNVADVKSVGCTASFVRSGLGGASTAIQVGPDELPGAHIFSVVPVAPDSFEYRSHALGGRYSYSGTIVQTLGTAGLVAVEINGGLPAAFVHSSFWGSAPASPFANDHHVVSFSANIAPEESNGSIGVSGSGLLKSFAGADAKSLEGTLIVTRANLSYRTSPSLANLETVDLALSWNRADASVEGSFIASGPVTDRSATSTVPAHVELTGSVKAIHGGVATQIFTGKVVADVSAYANYDATMLPSLKNYYMAGLTISGSISAPNRPRLELSVGTSGKNDGGAGPTTLAATYKSFGNGGVVPTQAVAMDFTGLGSSAAALSLTDTINNINIKVDRAAQTVEVRSSSAGGELVGALDGGKKLLTFVDGSIISLDFGL